MEEKRTLRPRPIGVLTEQPLVSVLIASHDCAAFIGAAVESVLAQSHAHCEVIVCDDGSTDGSREAVAALAARDRRVQLLCLENGGRAAALNAAYAASRGSIICLLEADDLFAPEKLAKTVASFREYPGAGLCLHYLQPIDAAGRSLGRPLPRALEHGWIAPKALERGAKGNFPPASGVSLRREIAACLFPVPGDFRAPADAYLREAAQFITAIAVTPETLASCRLRGANERGATLASTEKIKDLVLREYPQLLSAVQDTVRKYFGPENASRLSLLDCPAYLEEILLLYLLAPAADGTYVVPAREVFARMPASPHTLAWRLLFALPRPVARLLLGSSLAKGMIDAALGPVTQSLSKLPSP